MRNKNEGKFISRAFLLGDNCWSVFSLRASCTWDLWVYLSASSGSRCSNPHIVPLDKCVVSRNIWWFWVCDEKLTYQSSFKLVVLLVVVLLLLLLEMKICLLLVSHLFFMSRSHIHKYKGWSHFFVWFWNSQRIPFFFIHCTCMWFYHNE